MPLEPISPGKLISCSARASARLPHAPGPPHRCLSVEAFVPMATEHPKWVWRVTVAHKHSKDPVLYGKQQKLLSTNIFDVLWGCLCPEWIMNEWHEKKERSHYWFAFYGQRSLKMEKYCIFPNPSLALGFFSNPFFLVFLVVYKRGMWPLSGFHSGKLVMLMSVFKVCSGRATNDPFPLPIHRHCESPFHELPTFDCMFCITFSHQREQTRTMVSFAPKPVHRKPF